MANKYDDLISCTKFSHLYIACNVAPTWIFLCMETRAHIVDTRDDPSVAYHSWSPNWHQVVRLLRQHQLEVLNSLVNYTLSWSIPMATRVQTECSVICSLVAVS